MRVSDVKFSNRVTKDVLRWTGLSLFAGLVIFAIPKLTGFVFFEDYPADSAPKWPRGTVKFLMDFPNPETSPMSDGKTSFYPVFATAIGEWDAQITALILQTATQVGAARTIGNGLNVVWFDEDMYGLDFGANVLAVTYTVWTEVDSKRTIQETKMIFNTAWTWDSYRGPLVGAAVDFKRVALHEIGHSLGLTHPDQFGQDVDAVMNASVSDLDALQDDDKAGVRTLYAFDGGTGGLPPGRTRLDSGPKGLGEIDSGSGSGSGAMNVPSAASKGPAQSDVPVIETTSPARGALLVEASASSYTLEGSVKGSGKFYGLQSSSDGGKTWNFLPGYNARDKSFSTVLAMPARGESQTLLLRVVSQRSEHSATRTLIFRRAL